MRILTRLALATSAAILGAGLAVANAERGSQEEAKALLDKAIAHVNEVGTDKAFADFSRTDGGYVDRDLYVYCLDMEGNAFADFTRNDGGFVDRDLYVYCADMQGNLLAHGANPTLVGKNLMQIADPDGHKPIKEQIEIIEANGEGTMDYRWPNPTTKKIEPKSSFFKKLNDGRWCGVGYYKG